MQVEHFEPVYLVPEGPAEITEHGKRWLDALLTAVCKTENPPMMGGLTGLSQYGMSHLIDHINKNTAFTQPTTVSMALATAAPTTASTGASITEASYTGYTRITASGSLGAATAATPSVSTSTATLTFPNCTGGTSTLLGFILVDSATIGAGNALWTGTLASTVISTTQTPPTVASGALTLQITGT